MKILRTIGILALVAALVLGGAGSAFAQGGPPGKRHGFFGTVGIVGIELLTLTTEEGWTVEVTLPPAAKYMVPRETKGPVNRGEFVTVLGGDITVIAGRRVAVLATNVVEEPPGEFSGEAVRLMLIPSPDSPPLHTHRVGIVQAFSEGTSITIIDEDDVTHTFTLLNGTVYRPAKIDPSTEIVEGVSHVTVVTKGDPKKADLVAKAIVLHKPEE